MQQKYWLLAVFMFGCSQAAGPSGGAGDDSGPVEGDAGATSDAKAPHAGADGGVANDAGTDPTSTDVVPSGWLFTQGNKMYVSNGTSGAPWMGRGVNADDLFLCGYNNSLWMQSPEATLTTLATRAVSDWKANFVRVSLSMNSFATSASWVSGDASAYKTPMTAVINALGALPNTYVLVTLRSDASMSNPGGDDATRLPTAATDATYAALVDTFASSKSVLFGVSNEPGGNALSDATIRAAMDHAVGAIRQEEDKLGVPHHIVAVQGNDWTSNIGFYANNPLSYDNVVYEVHGYPPPASSYTYSNLPVIIGEYGTLSNATTFFADLESKQIPNLAWDFDSFSDCAPDLLTINQSASNVVPSSWGSTVKTYLTQH